MTTYQSSQSQALAGPSKSPSEDSYRIYACKWGWCRSTFSNSAELSHHVIHEHARRSIPVRRRDVPLIRRAEEGTGESLRFSYILSGHSSNSATEQSEKLSEGSRRDVSQASLVEPYSSLPSPPATSRANTSPLQNDQPLRPASSEHSLNMDDIISIPAAGIHPLDQDENTRSFASLSSPTESSASFAAPDIPNSPSFGSLVERSAKRKLAVDTLNKPITKKSRLNRHHPLSQSANSSTGSHASVEQHLTQSLESSEDELGGGEDVDNDDASSQESSDHEDSSSAKDAAHSSELAWGVSQPEASQRHQFTQPSLTQDSQFTGGNYELLTQAPSQFQTQTMESFPFHFHGLKSSTSSQMKYLSPPVPLPPSKYATSTPQQRQNWYQPPRLQPDVSQKNDQPGAVESRISPTKNSDPAITHSQGSQTRNSSKSKKFRSGTLQISPARLPRDRMIEESPTREQGSVHDDALLHDIYGDILSQQDSQSYMDSESQSLDDNFSYPPLQTQAPYESQSMSQY